MTEAPNDTEFTAYQLIPIMVKPDGAIEFGLCRYGECDLKPLVQLPNDGDPIVAPCLDLVRAEVSTVQPAGTFFRVGDWTLAWQNSDLLLLFHKTRRKCWTLKRNEKSKKMLGESLFMPPMPGFEKKPSGPFEWN